MISFTTILLVLVILACLSSHAYAFGAGDIPDFAWLNDKAFRHGDIENTLTELAKAVGHSHGGGGGGLLGFAKTVMSAASGAAGGKKFTKDDVKRVYFGNWLRDYSQAMDIAGLSKLTADSLVMVVAVLGFLEFGFATEEFQVTADRLGVYLPVEHIDNPKGYAAKEGDARQFHPKLRPPVEDRELEIDSRTGMKNYMASDNQGWDTSTAFIRRSLQTSIEHGRRAGGNDGADMWEAFRTMGQALHTLEDLLAHSNWCEIGLRKLGHENVFCHVGDNVTVDTPNGPAPPLITGTFGSADFFHSLLGEATDKLSQSSVTDLSAKLNDAKNQDQNEKLDALRKILGTIMHMGGSGEEDKIQQGEEMQQKSQAYNFDPDNIAPPEVQQQLWDLLKWRDGVYRQVLAQLSMIPGLTELIDSLTDALNAYVYTLLAPYLTPMLQQVTSVIGEGSKAVIDSDDQYEVFNNPDASDPSHSMMSKDHFALILNEPAGLIAKVVVEYAVNLIVPAWSDDSDPNQVIDRVLEAFHHPYYASGNSRVQEDMIRRLEAWLDTVDDREQTLECLTKESVREHRNKRFTDEQQQQIQDPHDHGPARNTGGGGGAYAQTSYGRAQEQSGSYGGRDNSQHEQSYGQQQQQSSYGQSDNYNSRSQYGRSNEHQQESRYGSSDRQEESRSSYQPSYGSSHDEGSGRRGGYNPSYDQDQEQSSYGRAENTYGRSENTYGSEGRSSNNYGRSENTYGSSERSENTYGRSENTYGSNDRSESGGYSGYGGGRDQSRSDYEGGGYGQRQERSEYGQQQSYGGDSGGYSGNREGSGHHGRRHEERESEGYGGGDSYGSRRNEDESYGGDSYGESRRERQNEGYGGGGGYNPGYSSESTYEQRNEGGYGGNSYGGGRRDDQDETFGAERLNLDEGEEHHGRRRHHEERNSEW